MFSTFMGVEVAKRSFQSSTYAMSTIQHNLTKMNDPNYSRQRTLLSTYQPLYMPGVSMGMGAGQVGQGVYTQSVERVNNQFIGSKITSETSYVSYFNTLSSYINRIDGVYNEPNGIGLNESITDFLNSFNKLSHNPQDMTSRQLVKQKAQIMTSQFHTKYDALREIQNDANADLGVSVGNVNNLLKRLGAINNKIQKIEATGQNPNDLKDTREALVNELANYIDIDVNDGKEFFVYVDGKILVQGEEYQQLELDNDESNTGFYNVLLNGDKVEYGAGKISGLIELRDNTVANQIEKLNQIALSMVEGVNALHQKGMNLKGNSQVSFFKELPLSIYSNGDYDFNSDGFSDRNVIYKVVGSKILKPNDKLMISGTLNINGKQITYNANDTVEDLINKINLANTGANAQLEDGKLVFKGNSSDKGIYGINQLSDTGSFLSAFSGILQEGQEFNSNNLEAVENLFLDTDQIYLISPERNIASWIDLSDSIKEDISNISAAQTTPELKEGDGSIAFNIGKLATKNHFIRNSSSIDEFYRGMVSDYANDGKLAQTEMDSHTMLLQNFQGLRDSYSGVNMDEELSNMMKFEKMYQASAKFLTQLSDMYDTIIGIVR